MSYLIKFAIGPVQDFIKESRKTRDLYAGSSLLSFLMKNAVRETLSQYHDKFELIIPNSISGSNDMPNMITGRINGDRANVKDIADYLKNSTNSTWRKITESVEKRMNSRMIVFNAGNRDLWKDQISDAFYTFWVAVPEEAEEGYEESYKKLQSLFEERKLSRIFTQFPIVQNPGKKCFQCGSRDILQQKGLWEDLKERFGLSFDEGETLCAICLVKRLLDLNQVEKPKLDVPSTHELAFNKRNKWLKKHLEEEKESKISKAWQYFWESVDLLNPLPKEKIEISFLASLLSPGGFEKEFPAADYAAEGSKDYWELAKSYYEELIKILPAEGGYYAVIFLDGDRMGEWLSGAYKPDCTGLEDWQTAIVKSITASADNFKNIASKKDTLLVYSGGDDLLAFCPLDELLQFLLELWSSFDNAFSSIKDIYGKNPTISGGIIIAHWNEPLQKVLQEGRAAEERAKKLYDRNAVALSLMLSSGNVIRGGGKWELKKGQSLMGFLQILAKQVQNGTSPNLFYDLESELPCFYERVSWGLSFPQKSEEMLRAEFQRLFRRHSKDVPPPPALLEGIIQLCHTGAPLPINALENTRNLLRIAYFLARKEVV